MRTYREGSAHVPMIVGRKPGLNLDRFWQKVSVTDGCWNWHGATKGKGYGAFWLGGKPVRAHRVSWEIVNGRVPKGQQVLHKCNNRKCVNPEHLYLGDNSLNMQDMHRAGNGYGTRCERCGWFLSKEELANGGALCRRHRQ